MAAAQTDGDQQWWENIWDKNAFENINEDPLNLNKTKRYDALLDFVGNCEAPTGEGYYSNPNYTENNQPNLENTFFALDLIDKIKKRVTNSSYTNSGQIQLFLSEIRNDSGGFRNYKEESMENIKCTYQGIKILDFFNMTSSINMTIQVEFVKNSQDSTGGFGPYPLLNNTPDVINTYHALKILDMAGELESVDLDKIHSFLNSCRIDGSIYSSNPNSTEPSIIATSIVVSIYKEILVNLTDVVLQDQGLKSAILNFTEVNYVEGAGFKEPIIGDRPTLASTFYTVKLLKDMRLSISHKSEIQDWILNHQDPDGGFYEGLETENKATSSMSATYYAVMTLYVIDPELSMLHVDVPWELNQLGTLITILVLIGGVITVIAIFSYLKKKKKI